ncbi:hydrolase [Frankia sp. AiPs1]|uniref:hydrolase n=1 Tax=Frankia sp. AiPs1 TaxID=573493 RepID=UPI0020448D2E|nr:hydrolase [Frankia sp. AiPs1]MCM3920958.1 hydrolase [Frankia sp. AiPs1]
MKLTTAGSTLQAAEVAVSAAKHVREAETDRRLPRASIDSVLAAGFARHFVPTRYGGDSGTFGALLPAVATIGASCASTAWVASLIAAAARMAAYLPEAGRAAVWADGPDALIVAGLMPGGEAAAGGDSWRLSGQWPYVSGVDHSDWALVCARVVRDGRGEYRFFAVPRPAYRIEPTWFNVGMRATGSNTLVLDDVRVPASHSVSLRVLTDGPAPGEDAPCHQVPMKAANGLTLTGPLLGAARGALHRWWSLIGPKLQQPGPAVSGPVDRLAYDMVLARSGGEIDTAGLLLERVARVLDEGAVTPYEESRNGRDCALAAEYLSAAVDRLMRGSGSRGQADGEDLGRFWRDVVCGAGHSGLQFAARAGAFARHAAEAVNDR